MVLEGTYPPDVRVAKEARALATEHDVALLCLGDSRGRERVEDLDVVRFPWDDFFVAERAVNRANYLLRSYAPLWHREIRSFADAEAVDVLHVHDLPLVDTAARVADERRVPLVADLHENWPEAIRQYRTEKDALPRALDTAKRPIRRIKRAERRAMGSDAVLTPVEEGREHNLRDCGAPPGRVHVVGNTVDLEHYDTDPDPIAFDGSDGFVVSYVGSFGPHRGLETLVDALPRLREQVPDATLLVVGSGSDRYERALRERVRRKGVADAVTFTGWVDFEDVPRYVAASDVPTVTHRDTPHTRTTVPHKLFQYMALGKPVLVTDVGPLGRIVENEDCGEVVPPDDPVVAADALARLATDTDRAAELGANARRAVEREYNWAADAQVLRRVYRSLD